MKLESSSSGAHHFFYLKTKTAQQLLRFWPTNNPANGNELLFWTNGAFEFCHSCDSASIVLMEWFRWTWLLIPWRIPPRKWSYLWVFQYPSNIYSCSNNQRFHFSMVLGTIWAYSVNILPLVFDIASLTNFFSNPFSWTNLSHVLWVEQPVGVRIASPFVSLTMKLTLNYS